MCLYGFPSGAIGHLPPKSDFCGHCFVNLSPFGTGCVGYVFDRGACSAFLCSLIPWGGPARPAIERVHPAGLPAARLP